MFFPLACMVFSHGSLWRYIFFALVVDVSCEDELIR